MRTGVSVSPIVPKTPCDARGRGDVDRTGAKGQQWAYCPQRAWYGLTAGEWYQASTTDLIQSVFLCAAAGWCNNNRSLVSFLPPPPHPGLHIPQFHIWSHLPPHLTELNNHSLIPTPTQSRPHRGLNARQVKNNSEVWNQPVGRLGRCSLS